MARLPFLLHLCFHPESTLARGVAERIHRALNDDPVVWGLQIPTAYVGHGGVEEPPGAVPSGGAERNVYVALADDDLNVSETWCEFVVGLAEAADAAEPGAALFVPVQLDDHAWPLDPRLAERSFVRATERDDEGDIAVSAFDRLLRRLVIEMCRFLDPVNSGAEGRAPTTVFISHTKADLRTDSSVIDAMLSALQADEPVNGWFDTGDIEAGSRFAERIDEGIADSSLLCVLTDHYASREWCRREVLLAKAAERPVVVIDALHSREARSFPYLGNLPVVRWSHTLDAAMQADAIVDDLLKETLRTLHTRIVLEAAAEPGDHVLIRPPELVTAAVGSGTVLYPDPPLGDEETKVLAAAGITATTPLLRMSSRHRDLAGCRIGLSMSDSTDIDRFGFGTAHLHATILELSRYLLVRGATLVYGGHLAEGGQTLALLEMVRSHNALSGLDPVERIECHVGWPVPVTKAQMSRYKFEAKLVRRPRPDGIDEIDHEDFTESIGDGGFFPADRSPLHRLAWSLGMERLRQGFGDARLDARIVLGGKYGPTWGAQPDGSSATGWYLGRIPGVLEEVVFAARQGTPVFLLGGFGGVARLVLDTVAGIDRPEIGWAYHRRAPGTDELRALYDERGLRWDGYDEIVAELRSLGLAGLNPLLGEDEHRRLGAARHVPEMLELLVEGLGRLPPRDESG